MAKAVLAGGRGFLGQALARALTAAGWEVVVLSRDARTDAPFREVQWNGETGGAWAAELEGAATLVNLAGRSINCVHTLENSRAIVDSRLGAVRALAKGWARAKHPPAAWVQASATGFYGNAGDRFCEETLPPGPGFLAEVCRLWEEAFAAVDLPETRRVVLRLGPVLDRQTGPFPALLGLTRKFLGGAAGTGRQYMSWVHRDDAVAMLAAAVMQPELSGTYNACAPGAVTNAEFMRELRAAVGRPWCPAAPEFAVRIFADKFFHTDANLALHGQRCAPQKFLATGFKFKHPAIGGAIRDLTFKEF
ncbi:MAG: TIGR01777 family oxidoreductase [Lacunisphaera sp.]|nr:TIGR01777 family oxidoreductase [Lacunisphaera sp.]